MKKSLFIICTLTPLSAFSVSPEECSRIENDRSRLACYDAIFQTRPASREVSAPTPNKNDTRKIVPETVHKMTSLPETPSPTVTNQTEVITQAKPPSDLESLNKDDLFGFENKVSAITDTSIKSVALGTFKNWTQKMKISLENGQTWQVTSSRKVFFKADNPQVTIEKGALGSFYMSIEGINRRLKVRRIK